MRAVLLRLAGLEDCKHRLQNPSLFLDQGMTNEG
jgi:hypothetical protein